MVDASNNYIVQFFLFLYTLNISMYYNFSLYTLNAYVYFLKYDKLRFKFVV